MRVHLILRCFFGRMSEASTVQSTHHIAARTLSVSSVTWRKSSCQVAVYVFFCMARNLLFACLCYIYTLHVYRHGRIATRSCIWCLDSVVLKACRWLESDHLSMQHETRGRYNCSPWARHNGGIKKQHKITWTLYLPPSLSTSYKGWRGVSVARGCEMIQHANLSTWSNMSKVDIQLYRIGFEKKWVTGVVFLGDVAPEQGFVNDSLKSVNLEPYFLPQTVSCWKGCFEPQSVVWQV